MLISPLVLWIIIGSITLLAIILCIYKKRKSYKHTFDNLKIPDVIPPICPLKDGDTLPSCASKIPYFWWDEEKQRYYSQCCSEGPIVSVTRAPFLNGVCNCDTCIKINKMNDNSCLVLGGYFLGIDDVKIKNGHQTEYTYTGTCQTGAGMARGSCKSCKTIVYTYGLGTFTGIIFVDGFPFGTNMTHFFCNRELINDERKIDRKTYGLLGFMKNTLRVSFEQTCKLGMCCRKKLTHADFDETQFRYSPNEEKCFQIAKRSNIYNNNNDGDPIVHIKENDDNNTTEL